MNEIKLVVKIELWKSRFKLNEWRFKTVEILPEQVAYDDSVPEEERYFIGISIARGTKEGVIFHDRPLKEEDIIHELLHVKHPSWEEEKINSYTKFVMEYYRLLNL